MLVLQASTFPENGVGQNAPNSCFPIPAVPSQTFEGGLEHLYPLTQNYYLRKFFLK